MRRLPILLVPLVILGLAGCPQKAHGPVGHARPQMAVVEWLSAVDGGDFDRAAALAPPDVPEAKRKILVETLAERFSGVHRVNDAPFALSPPQEGKIRVRVTLDYPGRGKVAQALTLRKIGGKWYVLPPPPPTRPAPAAKKTKAAPAPAPKGG